jgi:LAS superfamily LD-carboxypeptidase LdcB
MKRIFAVTAAVLLALTGCTSDTAVQRAEPSAAPPVSPVARPAFLAKPKTVDCTQPAAYAEAAKSNSHSIYALTWSPFGRSEKGWAVYAPAISHELKTQCAADTAGFAASLADWQGRHGVSASGTMDAATFEAMKSSWQNRRPFVALRGEGVCPDSPSEAKLATARAEESYGGKRIELRARALDAYRRMVAAARTALPELKDSRELLTIFSAHRSPEYDAARCERDGNCQGIVRAACSAHRTGLAMDIDVGAAPGFSVDSSADPNRLFQAQGAAYRWLLANAPRFGFINYAFEPWHWEWTGEQP